jgi:hypothetical protein
MIAFVALIIGFVYVLLEIAGASAYSPPESIYCSETSDCRSWLSQDHLDQKTEKKTRVSLPKPHQLPLVRSQSAIPGQKKSFYQQWGLVSDRSWMEHC